MALVQAMCMAPQERVCTCMYLAEVSGGSQGVSSGVAVASLLARLAGGLPMPVPLARSSRGSPGLAFAEEPPDDR